MAYRARRRRSDDYTPRLLHGLQSVPGHRFTASELKDRTGVPKKFVRRALTTDSETVAERPMHGVGMDKRGGRWWYWWVGEGAQLAPDSTGGETGAGDGMRAAKQARKRTRQVLKGLAELGEMRPALRPRRRPEYKRRRR